MVSAIAGQKTLAQRFEQALLENDSVVPFQAHAALVQGNVVQLVAGVSSAPANNDRLGFFGIVLEAVASGAEGRAVVHGLAKAKAGAAITLGSQCDVSADLKIDPAGTQTDGNCGFVALETAAADGDLVFVRIK